jgi:hypothetical protein
MAGKDRTTDERADLEREIAELEISAMLEPDALKAVALQRRWQKLVDYQQKRFPPEPQPQPHIRNNKDWLEWAVKNIPPDDRNYGWKDRYAQKLLGEMVKADKANKAIKPMKLQTIKARMRGNKLWPETDDRTTTK